MSDASYDPVTEELALRDLVHRYADVGEQPSPRPHAAALGQRHGRGVGLTASVSDDAV